MACFVIYEMYKEINILVGCIWCVILKEVGKLQL
jgi:hypothetical protein